MNRKDFTFDGWHLIGQFPKGDPDGVGSWLLHHGEEACLLEVPPGLTVDYVYHDLVRVDCALKYVAASHAHEDHLERKLWYELRATYGEGVKFFHPEDDFCMPVRLSLGGEPLWLLPAAKHSCHDVVAVFRGVAMTGDIELGTLESVNDEVDEDAKAESFAKLRKFERDYGYKINTVASAHLNDVRRNVDWGSLFTAEEVCRETA